MHDGHSPRPSASLELLKARAQLLHQLRMFFADREVLEVETPLLSRETALEPNLSSFHLPDSDRYLQTSPEFSMKRLLASGSGAIYQICKAFRQFEEGTRHNPEFTLLEWYRPNFTLEELGGEVADLLRISLEDRDMEWLPYAQVFEQFVGINPFVATAAELETIARQRCGAVGNFGDKDQLLDLLMCHLVEPNLGGEKFAFVHNFPASQAALAKITEDADGYKVARRFEVYVAGVELANGYDELTDAEEFAKRCALNRQLRMNKQLPQYPTPTELIAATQHIPECCGVAMGLDRLLMLREGYGDIQACLAFPFAFA